MTMNPGTSVMGLKRAMCKRLKRGPPESIDLCDAKGCILEDDHRFVSDQALFCIGVSLGPPKTVKLEVRDHRTGARLHVEVLDTASMETVRKKVARELRVKEKEIQVGHQKFTGSARRFEALATDELLNGRRRIYVNGTTVLIYLSLDQALQLQRDLIVAYSEPKFQADLDGLLSTYPMPESITQMKFREAFGKLVRMAQKECLARWGFEGDFAAQNMMTAFGKVAHTPEVYSLSLEIDKLLRITSGGMIAAPIKQKKPDQAEPKTAEQQPFRQETAKGKVSKAPVTITVRQAVDEEFEAPAPSIKVTVPADATMRKVKQAISEKLGMKRTTTIKLVFDLHGRAAKLRKTASLDSGMTFASFKDDEQIGSRRELLVLGADLRQAPQHLPRQVEVSVELSGLGSLPDGEVFVQVRRTATMREVREAVAWQVLTNQAETIMPSATKVSEVAGIGMIAATIGDSIAVDLLADDATLADCRRFLWVSADLAVQLRDPDLDQCLKDAFAEDSLESPGLEMEEVQDEPNMPQDVAADEATSPSNAAQKEDSLESPNFKVEEVQDEPNMPQDVVADEATSPSNAAPKEDSLKSPGLEVEDVQDEPHMPQDVVADEATSPSNAARKEDSLESPGLEVEEVQDEPKVPQDVVADEATNPLNAAGKEETTLLVEVPENATDWQVETLDKFLQLIGGRVAKRSPWQNQSGRDGSQRIIQLADLVVNESTKPPELPASDQMDVVVRSITAEGSGGTLHLCVPKDANVGMIRELVTQRCGGGGVAAHIRMVRRFTEVLFLPVDDSEPVEEEMHLLGIDLEGVTDDEPDTEARAETGTAKSESIGLLVAAMELLEDSEVQERLQEGLDADSHEVLAGWEPPWMADGFDELDSCTLQTVVAGTIHTWAESFSQLVEQMTTAAAAAAGAAGVNHGDVQEEDDEVLACEDQMGEADDDGALKLLETRCERGKHEEGDAESAISAIQQQIEQVLAEPEMEPEQEPDHDLNVEQEEADQIVMVELEHVSS
ncbi:unnamed protein product [Durusdinium trenchii]|uniref:Ubiquitin-like domain-containing protein n=1 Tax=Durusdinium trenchii TaxID=1381693 RepID=A0ABP0RZE6_9DINO